MGFDAVWISPVISNVEGETAHGEAYHGYWPNDFYSLNSHFGSVEDLKNLSKALHDRGMYLMVDIVVNHMGPNTTATTFSSQDSFSGYKTFPQESSYHPFHFVSPASYDPTTSNQTDVEQGWLGDSVAPLPDLNTENTEVVRTLNDWHRWVEGRHGQAYQARLLADFKSAAGVFTIGEVLHGDVDYVANYTRVLDSVLDYPTYFTVYSAFTAGPGQGNISAIESTVSASQKAYQHGASSVGSFLENQDQPRLLSKTKDLSCFDRDLDSSKEDFRHKERIVDVLTVEIRSKERFWRYTVFTSTMGMPLVLYSDASGRRIKDAGMMLGKPFTILLVTCRKQAIGLRWSSELYNYNKSSGKSLVNEIIRLDHTHRETSSVAFQT
ncbi:glycoside hydrolase family protein [Salix suchowensis]|nr:glycoside hydrolase family protein [Salix suchowensis]